MSRTITFLVHLAVSSFEGETDEPTPRDLETIAKNMEHAIEHFRANEGLSDADSDIYVEYVERVSPLET